MLEPSDIKSLITEVLEDLLYERELLTEGGAAGHMRHPFDLDDVKDGSGLVDKFKQIGKEIEGGNLPDTKVDGSNNSIKIVDDKFVADRGSQKELDIKGCSIECLRDRFPPTIDPETGEEKEHGMVKSMGETLEIFNDDFESLKPELKKLGVLDDPTKFLDIEYVKKKEEGGKSVNVLEYDHDFLKIHGVKQFYEKHDRKGKLIRPGSERPVNEKTGKPTKEASTPIPYDQKALDSLAEKVNKAGEKHGFAVYSLIPSKKTGEFDFAPVMSVPIPVTLSDGNVDEKTLGERLQAAKNRIGEEVATSDGRAPPAQGKEIYVKVLGTVADDLNADPARQVPLDQLLANPEDNQKAIDGAVFWHATRLLGNVIMDNMEVDHPAVSGPAKDHEGLVLTLAGDTFKTKITGEFILRGVASPHRKEAEPEEATAKGKTIALFPGSFKPPHKGHLSVIKAVAQDKNIDEIRIIISAPGKDVRSAKITPDKAKKVFEKYLQAAGINKPVSVEISSSPSPIGAAYEYISQVAAPGENILLLTSSADASRYAPKEMEKAKNLNKNADTITVDSLILPACRGEGCETADKISASTIRDIIDGHPDITLDQLQVALNHMPEPMSLQDKLATFEGLIDASLADKFSSEELNMLSESVIFIMEVIDKALDVVNETVRKTRDKKQWCVFAKTAKTKEGKPRGFGCRKSLKAARKRLAQVEGFKAMTEGDELEEYEIVEASAASGMGMGYSVPVPQSSSRDNFLEKHRAMPAIAQGFEP
tara:strand:- start:163 stop:2451 length:2289 start_codon:yes stop_codon:yes gene_type:complete